MLNICIPYKAKESEPLTCFKSFHIIRPRPDAVTQVQIPMFPLPYHEDMEYHFYARCGCCVLFQNSLALVSSDQKNVTNTTLDRQCCLFAKFGHAVMFSSSSFLSWCPAINTLLVQCFTYCGLITINVSH